MKYNYPIKYAVMPMKERRSKNDPLETVCYAIVKCYVLEEKKRHRADGTDYTRYYVVCPYRIDESYYHWKKLPPLERECEWVDNVYDTYEAALDEKTKKNIEAEPFLSKEKYMQLHNDRLDIFAQFEKDVEKGTPELKVDGKPKEQTIVSMSLSDGQLIRSDMSLYETIERRCGPAKTSFIAYTVSPRTFRRLQKATSVSEIDIEKITKTPLLIGQKDDEYLRLISPKGNKDTWLRGTNNTDCFYEYDEHTFTEEGADNYIFTLETYKDVVGAYGFNCKKKILSYGEQYRAAFEKFYKS